MPGRTWQQRAQTLNMQHRLKTFLNHHVEMAFRSRLPCRLTSTWHLGVQYARAGESSDGLRQHLWLKCNAGEAVGSVRLALTTWGQRKQHLEHACKCGRVGSLTHRLHWMQALFRTDYGTQGAEVEASCLLHRFCFPAVSCWVNIWSTLSRRELRGLNHLSRRVRACIRISVAPAARMQKHREGVSATSS